MLSSTTTSRLPGDHLGEGVELELDADVSESLVWLDEGAADVAVLEEAFAVRDTRSLGIADAGCGSRIGDACDQVCVDGVLPGQFCSHGLSGFIYQLALYDAVGAGEVDVLEDTEGFLAVAPPLETLYAVVADDDDLAGLDVAGELCSQVVQGAAL